MRLLVPHSMYNDQDCAHKQWTICLYSMCVVVDSVKWLQLVLGVYGPNSRLDSTCSDFVEPCFSNMADDKEAVVLVCTSQHCRYGPWVRWHKKLVLMPEHQRCRSHSLNLAATTDTAQALDAENGKAYKKIYREVIWVWRSVESYKS